MGGKNRHSQDRLYITATEWRNEHGGKKRKKTDEGQPVDFKKCALSMVNYETPCCLEEGVVFEFTALTKFLNKYKANPVSGTEATIKEILRLNMTKNQDGMWHCPVTCKVFTNNSHVVAIKVTGNVFSYEAIHELNIRTKNYTDLLSGEIFSRADIITLQDPTNEHHMSIRDVQNFQSLKILQHQNAASVDNRSRIKMTSAIDGVIKEIEEKKVSCEDLEKIVMNESLKPSTKEIKDIAEFWYLEPTLADLITGNEETGHRMSMSSTSSAADVVTKSVMKPAVPEEIRGARWKTLRTLGKKAYVQLQTNMGTINLELHCDIAPRTCWNFITSINQGHYDNMVFHRLIPDLMVQGSGPNREGTGGESVWGKILSDEFDSRLRHDKRGIISMANRSTNSSGSQFFITFKEASHLDNIHTVFGMVVGGMTTLDLIENIGCNVSNNAPRQEIKVVKAIIFRSPLEEADEILLKRIKNAIKSRKALNDFKVITQSDAASCPLTVQQHESQSLAASNKIGKYLSDSMVKLR